MAAITLLFGQQKFKTTIGALKLDAAISVTHDATSQVSKNPVEEGSDISDNIRLENRTLQIEGTITETPIVLLGSAFNIFTGAATGVGELTEFGDFSQQALAAGLGSISGLIATRNETDLLYPQKAFEYLMELRNNRIPFNVRTKLQVYKSMVLTRLNVPQTAAVGRQLKFSATLEQIQIAKTASIVLPERNTKNAPGATKNQNLGKKKGVEASESNKTLAKTALDKVKGLF